MRAPSLRGSVGGGERLQRVAVLATHEPGGHRLPIEELAGRIGRSPDVEQVATVRLPSADGARRDPHRLRERVGEIPADAVVLLAPRRWGARRLVPAPVVARRPVAIVQADGPEDLPEELDPPDPDAPWVVSAMAKDVFLEPTEGWAGTLWAGGRRALDLRADRARRSDLLAALRSGPSVVLYAGHGRTRGWGGYQALRWRHLAPESGDARRSIGVVLAFACDTLKRSRSRVPFGCRMVRSGLTRAYLGAAESVRTPDAEALADVVVELLAGEEHPTVAHLVGAVDRAVADRPDARRAWRRFRLVGDPAARVSGPAVPPLRLP